MSSAGPTGSEITTADNTYSSSGNGPSASSAPGSGGPPTSDSLGTRSASPETSPTALIPTSTFATSTRASSTLSEYKPGGYGGYSYPASFPYGDPSSSVPDSLPTDNACGKWVGVEVIIMVDELEICPDGQTITTTTTQTYEIMTRSICATSMSNVPCYVCAFGLPTETELMTVTVTSNTAKLEPEPTLAVHKCATCQRAVIKTSVEGHSPGAPCYGCATSSADLDSSSTEVMTLSDVETISLGSYSLGSYSMATTSTEYTTSTGYANSGEPVITPTPTPFASAPETYPTGNTPYGPPSASATYVTAGSARITARGAALGIVVMVVAALVF
ncbi:unnamed protein product [Discula destructiva]